MRAGQEHGRRAHVVLGAARVLAFPRRDLRVRKIADDAELIAKRRERLQDLGELEVLARFRRRPLVHRRAVRDVDAAQTALRPGCGLSERGARGNHRVQQRQREGGAGAAKQRAARQMFLRDEHAVPSARSPAAAAARAASSSFETARCSRCRARARRSGSRRAAASRTIARTAGMS